MRYLISVIGAGTAGLIAARRLGELGFDSTVYEQKQELGVPVRASGILSLTGLGRLGVDYSGCVTNVLYGANLHAGGRTLRVVSKKPVANVLDRKMLNDACYRQAEKNGAKLIMGRRMTGNALDELSKGGIVIGADGAVSSVARHFGFDGIKKFALTYKAEFDVEAPESGIVDLFFDKYSFNGLFAWTCPNRKDLLEVGVGLCGGMNAKEAFMKFLRNKEILDLVGGRKAVAEGASMIPLSMRKHIVDEKRRVLLIGDAAGQVKATTGGGIIFGGSGALIAADAVARHIKDGKALNSYETEFRKKHDLDLKLHSAIHRIYGSMGPSAMGKMISTLNALGMSRFLSDYGDMDRPSLVLKRFFLRRLAR